MTILEVPAITPQKPIWTKEHEECFTFSTSDTFYMSNLDGKIRITVCSTCGYEDVECLHINTKVNIAELKLECQLCGG